MFDLNVIVHNERVENIHKFLIIEMWDELATILAILLLS